MGGGHSAGPRRPLKHGLPGKMPSPSCCPQDRSPPGAQQQWRGRKGAPTGATALGVCPSPLPSLLAAEWGAAGLSGCSASLHFSLWTCT